MENQVTALQATNAPAQAVNNSTASLPSQADQATEMQAHIVELRAETLVKARTHGSGVNVDGLAHDLKNLPDETDRGQTVHATINRLSPSDRDSLKIAMGQPDTHPKPGFLQRFTRRTEAHIAKNFSEAFAAPLGPSNEFMRPTDELPGYLWPVQTINNVFYRGGGTVLDAAGRTIAAGYNSVVDTGVNIVDEGLKSAGFKGIPEAELLRRDLKGMPEAFAGSPGTLMRPKRIPAAENWGTGPVRLPARPVLRNEHILIDTAQGLQSRKSGVFQNVRMGQHGDPQTRYLWTVDKRGINIAWEKTPFPTDRGNIVHTNVSSEASMAGEAWFGPNNTVTINADSGRFGYQSGAPKQSWNAAVRHWEKLGYKVNVIPYGEK